MLGLIGTAGVATAIAGVAAAAVPRLSRSLAGKTVNIRDYCAADGRRIDTQSYQELIDLQPATIVYPAGAHLMLDRPIRLRGGQTHSFALGARIEAETPEYALSGLGRTGQHLADLAEPIRRYAHRVVLERSPAVRAGDIVALADVANPNDLQLEINVVERVEDNAIITRYPVGRPFVDRKGFRIYHLYDPLRDLRLIGEVTLLNHHRTGGGLRLTNTADAQVSGLVIENVGYIGINFESSLRGRFKGIAIRGSGASGFGLRASKDVLIDGFTARNVRGDESLTFYDNVAHVDARNIAIEQYLYQDRPSGYWAGCDILIDKLCSKVALGHVSCSGSATYNVMIHNESDDCSLTDFDLRRSNLGGVRVSSRSHNARISRGVISDVRDGYDQEGRKPVSAISVGSSCVGTTIGEDITYERIASGLRVGALRDGPA